MNLREILRERGYSEAEIKERMVYSAMYNKSKGVDHWIQSVNSILDRKARRSTPAAPCGLSTDRPPVISNYSGYGYKGSEDFEHEGNAAAINYSGVQYMVNEAFADHDGWEPGYDYD